MKKLIICNTYYQLILGIHMKLSLFNNDNVELWLSDHSNNSEPVAQRLKALNLFSDIKYTKNKNFVYGYDNNIIKDMRDVLTYSIGKSKQSNIDFFDEIIFFNLELQLFAINDFYKRNGHHVKWSHYEEGILTYKNTFCSSNRVKYTMKLRKLLGKNDIMSNIASYYCMFPELEEWHKDWEFIKIPGITEDIDELKNILNYIFDYTPKKIKYKYIYFAAAPKSDALTKEEFELVQKIIKIVGKDDLVVKMHPRDTNDIYKKNNINIMENSYIPWEVIQLNWDKENITLLTVNAGAFMNISALIDNNVKSYFIRYDSENMSGSLSDKINQVDNMLNKLHNIGLANNVQAVRLEDLKL